MRASRVPYGRLATIATSHAALAQQGRSRSRASSGAASSRAVTGGASWSITRWTLPRGHAGCEVDEGQVAVSRTHQAQPDRSGGCAQQGSAHGRPAGHAGDAGEAQGPGPRPFPQVGAALERWRGRGGGGDDEGAGAECGIELAPEPVEGRPGRGVLGGGDPGCDLEPLPSV